MYVMIEKRRVDAAVGFSRVLFSTVHGVRVFQSRMKMSIKNLHLMKELIIEMAPLVDVA